MIRYILVKLYYLIKKLFRKERWLIEKIDFINNQQPALNATNLNKIQDNVEDAIQEVQDDVDTKLTPNNIKSTQTTSATDTYSCNHINEIVKEIYSSEEQLIGEYFDKNLYKKTITGTTDSINYTLVLSASQYETIVDATGWIGGSGQGMNIGGYLNPNWFCGFHRDDSGNLVIYHENSNLKNKPFNATIKYTKTND